MVGLSHYSLSKDMLPRVIWQLVKINHNQDGCCHCHIENVTLGADRVWEEVHAWALLVQSERAEGGPGERKTEGKQ